jgi:hypothetical protein
MNEDEVREWVKKKYGFNYSIERKTTNYWYLNFKAWNNQPYQSHICLEHIVNVRYDPNDNEIKGPPTNDVRKLTLERINQLVLLVDEKVVKREGVELK